MKMFSQKIVINFSIKKNAIWYSLHDFFRHRNNSVILFIIKKYFQMLELKFISVNRYERQFTFLHLFNYMGSSNNTRYMVT